MKGKEKPNDVDIVTLFREKDYEKMEEINYHIKEMEPLFKIKLHVEPIIIDNLHQEKVYTNILHEGFSIKNMKFLNELLNFKSYSLITYSLKDKTASDKVRFSYALYGRKKGEGVLTIVDGVVVGKGSILIPISKQGIITDFFKQWNVGIKEQRVSIFKNVS